MWRSSSPIPPKGLRVAHRPDQAAAVTLDLACSVALADGDASGPELIHLTRHIESWTHLSVAHRKRLKAHLRLRIMQPTTLAGLKKLEPLAAEAKRTIAKFLAHLAEADGTGSPDEVKFLERVYKTLQVDAKLVDSDSTPQAYRSKVLWSPMYRRRRQRPDCP